VRRASCGQKGPFAINRVFTPPLRLSRLSSHGNHTSREADLSNHHRSVSPDGDFILVGERAHLPAGLQNDFPKSSTWPPAEGVFHNLVFVSIRKQYPYQGLQVMARLGEWGRAMFSNTVVVVDDDCDVQKRVKCSSALPCNTTPGATAHITNPSDSLDHAPSVQNVGSAHGLTHTANCPAKVMTGGGQSWWNGRRNAQTRHDDLQRKVRQSCLTGLRALNRLFRRLLNLTTRDRRRQNGSRERG